MEDYEKLGYLNEVCDKFIKKSFERIDDPYSYLDQILDNLIEIVSQLVHDIRVIHMHQQRNLNDIDRLKGIVEVMEIRIIKLTNEMSYLKEL